MSSELLDVGYTMGIAMVKPVVNAKSGICESGWMPIGYTPDGEAEVAEFVYNDRRVTVRRTGLKGHQAQLFPSRRHFRFVTHVGATQSR